MEPVLAQPPPKEPESDNNADGPINLKGPLDKRNQAAHSDQSKKDVDNSDANQVNGADNDHEGLKSIFTTLAIIVMAPIIAFTLTAFIFQSYQVDGQSMETTLQNEDRLIVLKLPKTLSKLTGSTYIPNRGDVIIFNKNDLAQFDGTNQKKQLVKRVIGLPGDHIVVKDSKITVYNAQHPQGFEPDTTLPYGKTSMETLSISNCSGEFCDVTVPDGEVYVCGDNRQNSLDSRIFGPVPSQDIVGKLALRIFPFNKAKSF